MNAVREQIRSMLTAESRDGGFRARLVVNPDFVLFPDHFSSQPIFPGICMLQAVLIAAGSAHGIGELHLKQLKNSKLLQPVLPGDEVLIEGEIANSTDGDLAIKARLFVTEQKRAEFSLIAHGAGDTQVASENVPSPGSPGEGNGGGQTGEGPWCNVAADETTLPPPQPSPGVPGKGERAVRKTSLRRQFIPRLAAAPQGRSSNVVLGAIVLVHQDTPLELHPTGAAAIPFRAAIARAASAPSPGTPKEGWGEGDFELQGPFVLESPTISRGTGRGSNPVADPGVIRANRNKRILKSRLRLPWPRCAASGAGALA